MGSALGGSPFKLQWLAQRSRTEACAPQDPRGQSGASAERKKFDKAALIFRQPRLRVLDRGKRALGVFCAGPASQLVCPRSRRSGAGSSLWRS